jgi:hypothetical protein
MRGRASHFLKADHFLAKAAAAGLKAGTASASVMQYF